MCTTKLQQYGMCNHPKILVQSAYESVVVQYLRLQIFCNKLFCYEKSKYFVVFSKFFCLRNLYEYTNNKVLWNRLLFLTPCDIMK